MENAYESDRAEKKEYRTVLIVDDEVNILSSIKRILRTESYRLLVAKRAGEALDILANEPVHILVTDISMPEMDGFTLLRKVEQINPDVIRLVLSGRSDIHTILSAINERNVYRYIVKPFESGELKIVIRQAVDLFNLQQDRRDLLSKLENHNILLEQNVQARTRQLLAAESAVEIGKHAAQIVHNLNNSLTVVQGALSLIQDILEDTAPDIESLRQWFATTKSSADQLGKIISEILLHARNEDSFRTEDVDINKTIGEEDIFFRINPLYRYKISTKFELAETLPLVEAKPIQIKQILDNLIKNSIDAMENMPERRLTIKTSTDGTMVTIEVADTGEGISKKDLPNIFFPDFTTKPVGRGTGLGLASVKTMVESYSGQILVESEEGRGTIFTVKLPVHKGHAKSHIDDL